MKKNDLINEYIGVITLIVIIVLAVVAIYFYNSRQPASVKKDISNTTISSIQLLEKQEILT